MCPDDPGSYTSWDLGPWWVQLCGTDFRLVAGRCDGLLSHPHKKNIITENKHTFQDSSGMNEEASQLPSDDDFHFADYHGSITLAGESL